MCSEGSDDSWGYTSEVKRSRRHDDSAECVDSEEATPLVPEAENGDEAVLRKLANLRERKASELLSSLAFPAAVQAQMTSAQPNANQGLTDARLKRVSSIYLVFLPHFNPTQRRDDRLRFSVSLLHRDRSGTYFA